LLVSADDLFDAGRRQIKVALLHGAGQYCVDDGRFGFGDMANQLAQGKHAFTRSPVELVFGGGGQRPRRLLVNAVPIANEMLGLWTTHRSLLCQVNMRYAGYYPLPAAAPQPQPSSVLTNCQSGVANSVGERL